MRGPDQQKKAKPLAAIAKEQAVADNVIVDTAPAWPGRRVDRHGPAGGDECLLTVTELARELGITARALRFYEDKDLITPRRVANTRVYTNRERARMILILRGKRLGFSLREIKDYLDLYDADPARLTQTRALLKKIETRTKQLEEQRIAVDQALKGLKELEIDALAVLAAAEQRGRAESLGRTSGKTRSNPLQRAGRRSSGAAAGHQESDS